MKTVPVKFENVAIAVRDLDEIGMHRNVSVDGSAHLDRHWLDSTAQVSG